MILRNRPKPSAPVVVDLFCGCGGFSLGARQAGFNSAMSIDKDLLLTHSFRKNFPESNLLIADITTLEAGHIVGAAENEIDGVIGGPPCQGFSSMGLGDQDDPRRELLLDFFRLVRGINPKFFLMENVRGLNYSKNRDVLERGLELLPKRYSVIGPILLDCARFGAATKRPRLFLFGFDKERMNPVREAMFEARIDPVTVRDAIDDLKHLRHSGQDADGYDLWRRSGANDISDYARLLRGRTRVTTGHRKTPHKPEIVSRFSAIKQGQKDEIGKHVRLSWEGQCPTLRAGTGSDRGSYQAVRPIHPSQARVITVREAARLQGFPDSFRFHPTIWHSFRMIGNSVNPIIAQSLLSTIGRCLDMPLIRQAAE